MRNFLNSSQNRVIVGVIGAAAALLFASATTLAHHAFSGEFDSKRPVNLRGTVVRMEWINPHAWIHLDVVEDDGSVKAWMVEGGTPNTLLRAGINKNSLPIGSDIVVRGYQSKDASCKPACKANGRDLAFGWNPNCISHRRALH